MKKILLLFASVLLSLPSWAGIKIGDLYYNLDDSSMTAEVTAESYEQDNYKDLSGALSIPETVVYNGKTYSVTSISTSAFAWCSGLESVTTGNSVISIGTAAFIECSNLTTVTIGSSVISKLVIPFEGCSSLKSINVVSGNPAYASVDGVLYTKNLDTLVCFPGGFKGGFKIPNSVTSIGDYAFEICEGLTSVEIPGSVTSIGAEAFFGCSGLTSIEIPASVTSIVGTAFTMCSGLKSINVDNGNAVYASVDGVVYTKNLDTLVCFPGGVKGRFEIPNSVAEIGEGAFYLCEGLTSVIIPNSVVKIGANSFQWCTGLISLFIGEKVSEIGEYAFDRCDGLEEVVCTSEDTPKGKYNTFSETTYKKATLFVPENSLEEYKRVLPWRFFSSIKDLGESDVDEINMDSSERHYDVINLNGQLLKRNASQSDIDALAPGIYIIGGKKVIIK